MNGPSGRIAIPVTPMKGRRLLRMLSSHAIRRSIANCTAITHGPIGWPTFTVTSTRARTFSLLIALAVFIALLPVGSNSNGSLAATCIAVDFFILVLVFCVARWCRVRHWHDRWLEYLLLAELIRQLRFLAPLGGVRLITSITAHIAIYGDPTQTWMY